MKTEEDKKKYERAVELYQDKDFHEAEQILERLAVEHPSSKHIMYYRALCLAGLGRNQEARQKYDELSSLKDLGARELKAKLEMTIKEALKAGRKRKTVRRATSAGDAPEKRAFPMRTATFALAPLAVLIVAGGVFAVHRYAEPPVFALGFQETVPDDGVPDKVLELATYFPAGTDQSHKLAIVLGVSKGEDASGMVEVNDCVAEPVATNWEALKTMAEKALIMTRASSEEVAGHPRKDLVITAVIPREGVALTGILAGGDIQQFAPGSNGSIDKIIAACGKPDHVETWAGASKSAGIKGEVQWWGRLGLATDETNSVSHILIRSYPPAPGKPQQAKN